MVYLEDTFGYPPPTDDISIPSIRNAFPIVEITPHTPELPDVGSGMTLFKMQPAWGEYHKHLVDHQFSFSEGQKSVKLAFIADNFPTDNFSNEYGESFFQGLTNVASEAASSIAQLAGVKSGGAAWKKLEDILKGSSGMFGDILGKGIAASRSAMTTIGSALNTMMPGTRSGLDIAGRLMMGGRLDFPSIWKGSGFSPSYSITVKLYNPAPGNKASTMKYIVGPIAAIAILALPISEGDFVYNWPYIHEIECKGLYRISPAFIGNISIIKGGDQQQIGHNQALGQVDIRIDFGSLYNSLLITAGGKANKDRPTLRGYLEVLGMTREPRDMNEMKKMGLEKDTEVKRGASQGSITNSPSEGGGVGTRINSADLNDSSTMIMETSPDFITHPY